MKEEVDCVYCGGTKKNEHGNTCEFCDGTGVVEREEWSGCECDFPVTCDGTGRVTCRGFHMDRNCFCSCDHEEDCIGCKNCEARP